MWTQTQYNALCEAIALGATRVNYGDKSVEYRSLAEMKQLKADMEQELGVKKVVKRKYAEFDRGF